MIAEIVYLKKFVVLFLGIMLLVAVSITIGISTHLGAIGTMTILFALGLAAMIGWTIRIVRRSYLRAGTNAVSNGEDDARYVPIVIDAVLLSWFCYQLTTMVIDLHRGNHISTDTLVINGGLFVWWVFNTIRDVRHKLLRQPANTTVGTQNTTAALLAAYALPEGGERRRTLASLRNRGLGRLALFFAIFPLFFAFEPHFGVGPAMLAAFAIVATISLSLHKLIGL